MGCFSVIHDFISKDGLIIPDFNKEPYRMGSFSDIINKNNKDDSFELGFLHEKEGIKYNLCFREKYEGAESIINRVDIDLKNISFTCKKEGEKNTYSISDQEGKFDPLKESFSDANEIPLGWYLLQSRMAQSRLGKEKKKNSQKKHILEMWKMVRSYQDQYFSKEIFNLAPVRSKPQRTYDPIKEFPNSEGGDIPSFLMQLHTRNNQIWEEIREKMVGFGKSSGMFSDIEIKRYGTTMGEPFQLKFQIRNNLSNIIDTGYGVGQILPLLTRIFISDSAKSEDTKFLLQQPEVHLHPKAQAELASLLVQSTQMNNSFLIETHSDYIIDRTRIEIRRGNIAPDKVSLIYLEPLKDTVQVHNLHFDDQGDLLGAPIGYRDFFDKESDRFLGFDD